MNNPVQPSRCEILHVQQESAHEWTFRVATDARPDHGQFMQLSIPKVGEAPISVSARGDGWLEFTIRSVGRVTDHIFTKRAGDALFLRGPYGKGWPMEAFRGKHMVVITGGTGLASARSMLRFFSETPGYTRDVWLLAGFKDEEDIIFREELRAWRERFHTVYTLDAGRREGWRTGFVTEFVREIPFGAFDGAYAVAVVGPPAMMHFTGLELVKRGAEPDNIWMSFSRKMSCGTGKCGHCRINEVYVCLDGPVFPYSVASGLVD